MKKIKGKQRSVRVLHEYKRAETKYFRRIREQKSKGTKEGVKGKKIKLLGSGNKREQKDVEGKREEIVAGIKERGVKQGKRWRGRKTKRGLMLRRDELNSFFPTCYLQNSERLPKGRRNRKF